MVVSITHILAKYGVDNRDEVSSTFTQAMSDVRPDAMIGPELWPSYHTVRTVLLLSVLQCNGEVLCDSESLVEDVFLHVSTLEIN